MKAFEKLLDLVIKPIGDAPIYNCMVAVKDYKNDFSFYGAKGTFRDKQVTKDMLFRTGSMTKPFMASVVLQLLEEGLFNLEDSFVDLLNKEQRNFFSGLHIVNEIDYSHTITIEHLLQHRSGLRDYFSDDDEFLSFVMEHPTQSWSWQTVMEKYFQLGLNKKSIFQPGHGFHYADTNYLLLAMLIEHVTGKPLYQLFDERICTPLSLNDTYMEFYQNPKTPATVVYPYYGKHSLEYVNTSFDWGGGGLISGLDDLNTFLHSLVNGSIFKKEKTLQLMLQFLNSDLEKSQVAYGLGIQKKELNGHYFVGHRSAYGSLMFYEPKLNICIILTLNQSAATLKAEWMLSAIVKEYLISK
jgi:D-alanyl-D-alanine carboxypeptidase